MEASTPQVMACRADEYIHAKRTGERSTHGWFGIIRADIGLDDCFHALSVDLGMI